MESVVTEQQFPVGETADKLLASISKARALRDLGIVTDANKKDYKLDDSKTTLTISFGADVRTFTVGGPVFGGADRYVMDNASKHGYVLSQSIMQSLESGKISLQLADPRGFDNAKLNSVTVTAPGAKPRTKTVSKITAAAEGTSAKTWGDPKTNKADQTMANFVDNAASLRVTEYKPELKVTELTEVVSFAYADDKGAPLGAMKLYKRSRVDTADAPTPAAAALTAPAAPPTPTPKTITEYFIVTPKTRVPGLVASAVAEKTENDLTTVFGQE